MANHQEEHDGERQGPPEPKVGYKNPPIQHRFRSGVSGNPRGRPKGAQNFTTLLTKELDSLVAITEAGVRKNITKRRATVKQLVNRAASGDHKALALLLAEIRNLEGGREQALPATREFHEGDRRVIANLATRLAAQVPNPAAEPVVARPESSDPEETP